MCVWCVCVHMYVSMGVGVNNNRVFLVPVLVHVNVCPRWSFVCGFVCLAI